MRAVVVDLLCDTPYYCAALVGALRAAGVEAELASPAFYLEPHYLDDASCAPWVTNLVVHASRPRALRLAGRSIETSLNVARLRARVAAGAYDVVHVQGIPFEERTAAFMGMLRRHCDATGALLVHTAHNAVPHDRPGTDLTMIRRNLDLAHLLIALTDHVAAELTDTVHAVAPIEVVPHGPLFVDRALPDRAAAASRLRVRSSEPIVLFLGLLRPYKGLDLLAAAWPIVKEAVPEAHLLVVGKRGDRGIEADLDRLRGQSGVDVVESYVSVPAMLDYYAVSSLVVVPYRRISQSGALMTAIGLGLPTVLTPVDGLLEQARGLESAVVAAELSGPAIASSIVSSLGRTDDLARAAARDRVRIADSTLGWRSIGRATADAYERGLRGLGAPA